MRRFIVIIGLAFGIPNIVVADIDVGKWILIEDIFQPGRMWIYKTSFINTKGDTIDSQKVTLEVLKELFVSTQRKIKWRYDKLREPKTKWKREKTKEAEGTGVVETKDFIFLHPPRSATPRSTKSFRFTQFASFPWVYKPPKKGRKWEPEMRNDVYKPPKEWKENKMGIGWDAHDRLIIKNYYEIIGQKDISTLMREFSNCWQIDTRAESEAGIYKATFYFHPEYGFVRWEYTKPDGEQVILDLEKVSGFEN